MSDSEEEGPDAVCHPLGCAIMRGERYFIQEVPVVVEPQFFHERASTTGGHRWLL